MRSDDQPCGKREGTPRATADAFADAYARRGYSAPRILTLFDDPTHCDAHAALQALGELAIRRIITAAVVRWPAARIIDRLERGAS